ncbi:F-box protein At2g39490-like [Durio zibethinus]|uniref:F-box protein At2g39490-like n=1 Tax=Durio zibethinus TaxID=66656 RepID=A0A6P6AIP0_DURZI|nr:F-box protein At2g39490-like [Durio zibethinus]
MDPKDFISCLPDEILFRIITFLPFESAIQTTFLSTRWKDLWKKALVLNRTIEDAVAIILSYLDELHRPTNQWGFQFNFGHGRVLFAAIATNNTLHLDFSLGEQEFPMLFDWLLPLNLPSRHKWPFPYMRDEKINPPLSPDQQFKIKTLYLISVSRFSSRALTSLVSNLPFLESLTIAKCNGVQSLDIEDAARLQKLVVLDCQQLEYFCFGGSCLNSFRYRGRLVSFRFKLSCKCYCSDLRLPFLSDCAFHKGDAMLDFRQGPLTQWTWEVEKPHVYSPFYLGLMMDTSSYCGCANKFKCFNSIVKSINGVQSLTLCRWFFEKSICKNLPSSSGDIEICFKQLKDLWWIDCSMERENINALICFLNLCPNLERLYVTIDHKCYDLPCTEKFSGIVSGPDKLNDLKVVKLEGYSDEKKEIFLARRLVPLFRDSPLIISKSNGTCLRQLVKVRKLEKKGKYPYKFKVVENPHEICPDHVHMNL